MVELVDSTVVSFAASMHGILGDQDLALFRTRVCERHRQGNCFIADKCPNSHCQTWQRRNPKEYTYSPKLCPEIEFIKRGSKMTLVRRCGRGRGCMFAHSKEEELYHPNMYKTKFCNSHPWCTRYFCPFAHSPEELRKRSSSTGSQKELSVKAARNITTRSVGSKSKAQKGTNNRKTASTTSTAGATTTTSCYNTTGQSGHSHHNNVRNGNGRKQQQRPGSPVSSSTCASNTASSPAVPPHIMPLGRGGDDANSVPPFPNHQGKAPSWTSNSTDEPLERLRRLSRGSLEQQPPPQQQRFAVDELPLDQSVVLPKTRNENLGLSNHTGVAQHAPDVTSTPWQSCFNNQTDHCESSNQQLLSSSSPSNHGSVWTLQPNGSLLPATSTIATNDIRNSTTAAGIADGQQHMSRSESANVEAYRNLLAAMLGESNPSSAAAVEQFFMRNTANDRLSGRHMPPCDNVSPNLECSKIGEVANNNLSLDRSNYNFSAVDKGPFEINNLCDPDICYPDVIDTSFMDNNSTVWASPIADATNLCGDDPPDNTNWASVINLTNYAYIGQSAPNNSGCSLAKPAAVQESSAGMLSGCEASLSGGGTSAVVATPANNRHSSGGDVLPPPYLNVPDAQGLGSTKDEHALELLLSRIAESLSSTAAPESTEEDCPQKLFYNGNENNNNLSHRLKEGYNNNNHRFPENDAKAQQQQPQPNITCKINNTNSGESTSVADGGCVAANTDWSESSFASSFSFLKSLASGEHNATTTDDLLQQRSLVPSNLFLGGEVPNHGTSSTSASSDMSSSSSVSSAGHDSSKMDSSIVAAGDSVDHKGRSTAAADDPLRILSTLGLGPKGWVPEYDTALSKKHMDDLRRYYGVILPAKSSSRGTDDETSHNNGLS